VSERQRANHGLSASRAVIDLDYEPLRRQPPGLRRRAARWRAALGRLRADRWRRALPAAVVVATLLGVSAAAPLAGPLAGTPATIRFAGPDDAFRVIGDRILVSASGGLALYTIDGRHLWTTRFPSVVVPSARIAGDVLLVSAGEVTAPGSVTVAVDARTGSIRWQRAGLVSAILGDTVVVGGGMTITGVGVAEGRVLWTYQPPPQTRTVPVTDGGTGRITRDLVGVVEIAGTGAATFVDLRDLARHPVAPWAAAAGPEPVRIPLDGGALVQVASLVSNAAAFLVGGRLVAAEPAGQRTVRLHASRLDTIEPLWTVERNGTPADLRVCGDLLCQQTAGELVALDPATGAERWRVSSYRTTAVVGGTLFVTHGNQLGDVGPVAVVEAATGRVVFAATGWRWLALGEEWAVLGRPADGGYLQLASLEVRTGRLFDLARVRGWHRDCWSNDTSITCATDDQILLTHRYRP